MLQIMVLLFFFVSSPALRFKWVFLISSFPLFICLLAFWLPENLRYFTKHSWAKESVFTPYPKIYLLSCIILSSPRRSQGGELMLYSPGVGVRTWLKFLKQILYRSYFLSYLHHTYMDGASGHTTWMLNLGHKFQMLEEVMIFWSRFKF